MKPLSEIVDLLEHVRGHKDMYFEHINEESVQNFVAGFLVACLAAEIPLTWATWYAAAEDRGWQAVDNKSLTCVMRERGLNEDRIMDELFEILIFAVRRAFAAR